MTASRRQTGQRRMTPPEPASAQSVSRLLCVVPLILRGESIGTLSVVSREKDPYSEEDAQFLQEVAIQVALAIENMKSYEEIATGFP